MMSNRKKAIAFELKFEGFQYREIAKQSGYSVNTLKRYFSRQGKWYQEYLHWSNERIDEYHTRVRHMIHAYAMDAARALVRLMSESNNASVRLRAAGSILDRAGFGVKKVETQTTADFQDEAEAHMKLIEAFKQKYSSQAKVNTNG